MGDDDVDISIYESAEEQKKREDKLNQAFQAIFTGEHRDTVLRDLMERFYVTSPMCMGSNEFLCHQEGQRNVVLYILARLGVDFGRAL